MVGPHPLRIISRKSSLIILILPDPNPHKIWSYWKTCITLKRYLANIQSLLSAAKKSPGNITLPLMDSIQNTFRFTIATSYVLGNVSLCIKQFLTIALFVVVFRRSVIIIISTGKRAFTRPFVVGTFWHYLNIVPTWSRWWHNWRPIEVCIKTRRGYMFMCSLVHKAE